MHHASEESQNLRKNLLCDDSVEVRNAGTINQVLLIGLIKKAHIDLESSDILHF